MKKKISKFSSVFLILALFPVFVFSASTVSNISDFFAKIGSILNSLIPILITLALAYFIWGVIKYFMWGGEEAKKEGKDIMIYGLIGLAVIIGIWGFVNIVITTFGGAGTAPKIQSSSVSCTLSSNSTFADLMCYITKIINDSVIPLLFALATITFFWGVIKFFFINAEEEAKRAQGKQYMIWGIVALAVMLSIWGLVGILENTFNINVGTSVLPHVKPSN